MCGSLTRTPFSFSIVSCVLVVFQNVPSLDDTLQEPLESVPLGLSRSLFYTLNIPVRLWLLFYPFSQLGQIVKLRACMHRRIDRQPVTTCRSVSALNPSPTFKCPCPRDNLVYKPVFDFMSQHNYVSSASNSTKSDVLLLAFAPHCLSRATLGFADTTD